MPRRATRPIVELPLVSNNEAIASAWSGIRGGTTDRMALGEVLNIVAVQTAAALQALSDFHAHMVVANIGTSDRETRALLASLRDPDATPRHATQGPAGNLPTLEKQLPTGARPSQGGGGSRHDTAHIRYRPARQPHAPD